MPLHIPRRWEMIDLDKVGYHGCPNLLQVLLIKAQKDNCVMYSSDSLRICAGEGKNCCFRDEESQHPWQVCLEVLAQIVDFNNIRCASVICHFYAAWVWLRRQSRVIPTDERHPLFVSEMAASFMGC